MYEWTNWLDEVTQYTNRFTETPNGDGTITHTKVPGTVMQAGTNQDAAHFNNIEKGLVAAHMALGILQALIRQNILIFETGEATLNNTQKFPFNNSVSTVALAKVSDTADYIVICEVKSSNGNVESIVTSDKLRNGFKLAFTGSATGAVIKYTVIGGYLK